MPDKCPFRWHGYLVPLDQLIRDTPGAHPITSSGELRNGAFETDEELDTSGRSWPCPPRLNARQCSTGSAWPSGGMGTGRPRGEIREAP